MDESLRLLIAEDDAELRSLLQRTLAREGFDVATVADGAEALEELGQREYDLLISDLRMPRCAGDILVAKVRASHPGLKVIVMSGYAELDDFLRVIDAGAVDFVAKPFKIPDLLDVIDRAMDLAS